MLLCLRALTVKLGQSGAGQPGPADSLLVKEDDVIGGRDLLVLLCQEECPGLRIIVHHGGPGREALNLGIDQRSHSEPDTFNIELILLTTITSELDIAFAIPVVHPLRAG